MPPNEQGFRDADLARFLQRLPQNLGRVTPATRGRAHFVPDVTPIEMKHRNQSPSETTPPDEPIRIEEQQRTLGHPVFGQVAIVLETLGELEVTVGIGEERDEAVVPLVAKLAGEFEEAGLVKRPVQPLEVEVSSTHAAKL